MRILLTTHAFLPRSLAGVEVYTARLARALADLGHSALVLTATHDLAAPPYSLRRRDVGGLDVVEIVNTHMEGTLEATYSNPAIDEAIARVVDDFHPDCIHAQHLLNLSTGLFEISRKRDLPVFLTLHDYWLSCPRDGLRMQANGALCATVDHRICASCLADSPYLPSPLQRGASRALRVAGLGGALHVARRALPRVTAAALAALRLAWPAKRSGLAGALDTRDSRLRRRLRDAHAILAPTRFASDRAVEWGAPPEKVRVLSLGAIEGPTLPRSARSRSRVGYLGTVAPHKGIHLLIEALRGLPRQDWSLDIVGNPALDPDYTTRLRALAGDDPRIRFRGAIPPTAQKGFWDSVDLLVLPSLWWENSPLTVLEALAAGIPVIASRTGGVAEVIPEGAGALVPPGDVAALRAAVLDVLEGRVLDGPLDALTIKTAHEGAVELAALYADALRR